MSFEKATFGAGCFWCVEAVFSVLKGVQSLSSGYSGGHIKNPSYREVCNKTTGHAEVIQITFDPAIISYSQLLKVFWTTHDPTTVDRQGNDIGPQYRSVIFCHDNEQLSLANEIKNEYARELWGREIVTQILPFDVFYPAEDYHQKFYEMNTDYPYCQYIIEPKLAKARAAFRDLLK